MKYLARIISGLLSIALISAAAAGAQPRCASQIKSPDAKANVAGLLAIGEDMQIVLAWNNNTSLPPSTKIRVRAPGQGTVASQTVIPLEGDLTTTLVPGVFSNVAGNGLQYRIKVGGNLIQPYDFQVGIDCPPGPHCVYKVEGGVRSKSEMAVDVALADLLDTLGGSPDVLADALVADPTLKGQIATLALGLDRLDQKVAIPIGPCSCVWTYGIDRTPPERTFDPFEGQSFEQGGFEGPGSAHNIGAQSIGMSSTGLSAEGTSRLEMDLRCWNFLSWGSLTVGLPGGPESIKTPVMTSCPPPCTGEIQHRLRYEARLAALAVGGPTTSGIAAASQIADYKIDNVVLINELWAASAVADPGPGPSQALQSLLTDPLTGAYETDVECADRSLGQVRTAPTEAELHVFGNVLADGGADAFGVAETGNRYLMRATGLASCALQPALRVTITDTLSYAGDPLAIKPQKVTIQPYCWD